MTKQSSNTEGYDNGGKSPASCLNRVYEMYRRSHHYDLRKTQEKIYIMNLAEVNKYDILMLEEAINIYKSKKNDDDKRPHPNYFMAICRRLAKDFKPPEKINWGKTI